MQNSYLKDNGLSSTHRKHCTLTLTYYVFFHFLLKAASLAFLATSTFATPFDPIGIAPLNYAITAVGPRQAV